MPTLLNFHHIKKTIARQPNNEIIQSSLVVYIGRRAMKSGFPKASPLANKFPLNNHGRAECINLYENWLDKELLANDLVLNAILDIRPNTQLICYCAPLACHGDVIIKKWKWLHKVATSNLINAYLLSLNMLKQCELQASLYDPRWTPYYEKSHNGTHLATLEQRSQSHLVEIRASILEY